MAIQQFQVLFCQRFRCPPEKYAKRAFRKCLYWHAKLLVPVLRRLNPGFFAEDFKFIRNLGESTDVRDADVDVMNFSDVNRFRRGSWRTDLKIRVSGRKASRLAHKLFAEEREAGVRPG